MQPNQCSMRYILMGSGPEGFLVVRELLFPCLEVSLHCPRSVQDILEEKMAKGMGVGSWDILWMRAPRPTWCGLVTHWRACVWHAKCPCFSLQKWWKILLPRKHLFGCYFVSKYKPVRLLFCLKQQLYNHVLHTWASSSCQFQCNEGAIME